MANNRFFNKFPLIKYNGADCVNITERVALLQSVFMNAYLYYPYDLQGDERADQFANRYYGDSLESWILYLSNQIYDPFRQWYQPVDIFNELVTEKYGSVQLAIQKTKFYRNNWENGDSITVSAYDALTPILQGYYQPQTVGHRIVGYQRRQTDWTINTNRIISYTVTNTGFIDDEIVNIVMNSNNMGEGQVLSVDTSSNTLFVQHVNGVYLTSTSYLQDENQDYIIQDPNDAFILVDGDSYIYGTESRANSNFSVFANGQFIPSQVVCENLTPAEDVYWTPVTYYDWENEQNEYNKTIRVLANTFAPTVVSNLQQLLSS